MNVADKVSTGLLAAAIVANIVSDQTGHGTICSNTRPLFPHDEETERFTTTGKVLAVVVWGGFSAWFLPHYVNGKVARHVSR